MLRIDVPQRMSLAPSEPRIAPPARALHTVNWTVVGQQGSLERGRTDLPILAPGDKKSGEKDRMKQDRRAPDSDVDARGHRCPMPLLMAKRALNKLVEGQELQLVATDPGSLRDFEAFARQSGHALLEAQEKDGEYHFRIQKR